MFIALNFINFGVPLIFVHFDCVKVKGYKGKIMSLHLPFLINIHDFIKQSLIQKNKRFGIKNF